MAQRRLDGDLERLLLCRAESPRHLVMSADLDPEDPEVQRLVVKLAATPRWPEGPPSAAQLDALELPDCSTCPAREECPQARTGPRGEGSGDNSTPR